MKKYISRTINLVLIFCVISLNGQNIEVDRFYYGDAETTDFKTIQERMEAYYKDLDKGRGTGYKQWKRWEYYHKQRLDSQGQLINYAALKAAEFKKYIKNNPTTNSSLQRSNSGYWSVLAPTDGYTTGSSGYNGGLGRINVIAFHPTNANIVYAGSPGGGLWRTNDSGISWTSLTDGIPRTGVSGISVHPTNPNIIYILTGDGDGRNLPCYGVLKTYDGGVSWKETDLSFDEYGSVYGYKLAMHPTNPNILFALTTIGIYKTNNAGVAWENVQSGSFRDLEFKPGDPNTIYACTSNQFLRSSDAGENWTFQNSGLPTGERRCAIAVTADDPSCVYYLAGGGGPTGQYKGLYRSTNGGSSFVLRHNAPNILDGNLDGMNDCSNGCDQATYDLAIASNPSEVSDIYVGGINGWRSTDFGFNFTINAHWNSSTAASNSLQYIHADIHELVYNPVDGSLWCGSDGGIFRSFNAGLTWSDRSSVGSDNGLQIMQFYRIDGAESNVNIIVGGTQDNGSNRWAGGNDVIHFDGADGMDCMIDPTNSSIQYHCRQRGGLRKSINSGDTHINIRPGNTPGDWVTPIDIDPNNPTEIWAGYKDTIYRSTNAGASWTAFKPESFSGFYSYIHCSPFDEDRVYASSETKLFRSDDNGTNWFNISAGVPIGSLGRSITSICTDVNNSLNVWVTLSGVIDGSKVYYSGNAGITWENISGSLPNVNTNMIVYDQRDSPDNAVYLANDLGVFYRDGSMNDWVPFRNGLPNVEVMDLDVNVNVNQLRAGTYGRGLWTSSLYSNCPPSYILTDSNSPGIGLDGYRFYQAGTSLSSTRELPGSIGTEVYYKAGNNVTLNPGFTAKIGIEKFEASVGPCGTGVPENE